MGHYASPEEAYGAFFENFNAKNADGWAGVMSYPHVRVAPVAGPEVQKVAAGVPRTPARLFPTAADYAAMANWERFERTGWVRTQGIPTERVHESETMVHLAGGWSRYNAAGEAFVTNRVTYVLTKLDEGWGIQARFGVDSWVEGEDQSAAEQAAAALVERAIGLELEGDMAAVAACCRYPLTIVGVGEVVQFGSAEELVELSQLPGPRPGTVSARPVQSGRRGVTLSARVETGETVGQRLVLVTQDEDDWKIAAVAPMPGEYD